MLLSLTFDLAPIRVTAQENWASMSSSTSGITSRDGRSVHREQPCRRTLMVSTLVLCLCCLLFVVSCFQGIYVNYDADHSGAINAKELPGAFKAAGKKCCSVSAFV